MSKSNNFLTFNDASASDKDLRKPSCPSISSSHASQWRKVELALCQLVSVCHRPTAKFENGSTAFFIRPEWVTGDTGGSSYQIQLRI